MNNTSYFFSFFSIIFLVGCGSTSLVSTPKENIDVIPLKIVPLEESQKKHWGHLDLIKDTVPGMSVEKAYEELLKDKTGKTVVVAVIDSGIDIEHEDLRDVIWTNSDEIPDNGIDDDQNGYIDDVNGWNFIGTMTGANYELTRILKLGDDGSELYQKAKKEREKKLEDTYAQKKQVDYIVEMIPPAQKLIRQHLQKEDFTEDDLKGIESDNQEIKEAQGLLMFLAANNLTLEGAVEYQNYLNDRVDYHFNLDFDDRKQLGDDPNDITDTDYGNPNVVGPDKKEADHGTHVSGIIAAKRNNGIGINGIANNVLIMPIRAVPNGDEYDKDVALAIRYAVDNGAAIINTSFGKGYSPHPEWVYDAIRYAAKNDVLIVNAAGNDAKNIDLAEDPIYPNDQTIGGDEISNTFLTVGALSHRYGGEMVSSFSNYGKINVDVFAPGSDIWSCKPNNTYEFASGTSMAAPAVSGVAALIRSYYPHLSAAEVKTLLMNSGMPVKKQVVVGEKDSAVSFDSLCKSGAIVNAYNALVLASKK
jgi:subtilisin family serine protease